MPSIYQLKPRFQALLRPTVQRLYDCGVTANQVTVAAGIVSLLLGLLLVILLLSLYTLYNRVRQGLAHAN